MLHSRNVIEQYIVQNKCDQQSLNSTNNYFNLVVIVCSNDRNIRFCVCVCTYYIENKRLPQHNQLYFKYIQNYMVQTYKFGLEEGSFNCYVE
jgi:hypothetical protein